jgi:transcriptional regulator with XRE-family HTH domain
MPTRKFVIRSGADLGRTVAEARLARGLTQEQLAEETGVERTYLARLEAGHSVLLIDRALSVLRRLGVEVHATQDTGSG